MRILAFVAAVGFAYLSACGSNDDNVVAPDGFSGVFIMQTFAGQSLPAVVIDSAVPPIRVDLISGSLTLHSDRTFNSVTELRATISGLDSTRLLECSGTFTSSAGTLTFVEVAGTRNCVRTFTGTLNGGTFTTVLFGDTAVYTR